ncbi:hypothetical protein DER45DRAFT_470875, partial [Fusarium avenaceum]
GAVLRSYITCQIDTPVGGVFFDLTQTYDYVPTGISFDKLHTFLGSGFLSRSQTTQASLWWAESLMSTYWSITTLMLKDPGSEFSNGKDTAELSKGTISFTANKTYSDIQDPIFFKLDYRFVGTTIDGVYCCPDIPGPLTAEKLNKTNERPMIWIEADTLAKAAYSTILVDLGQRKPESNILTDTKLLTDFTSSLTGLKSAVNLFPGPANDSYAVLGKSTGPLGIKPSVI